MKKISTLFVAAAIALSATSVVSCKSKKKVICIQIKSYIHLGTPNEYYEYKYWNGRGKNLIHSMNDYANE